MNLFERESSSLRLAQTRHQATWDDDYRAKAILV